MRDYLSPAKDYLGRAKAQVASLSKVAFKPRVIAMFASTATIALFAAGIVTLKTMAQQSSQNDTVIETKVSPGQTSVTQTVTQPDTTTTETLDDSSAPEASGNSHSSSESKTSVTVNNQSIDVPKNGSVQRTITNDNGTTQVNVSTSSNSSDTATNISTQTSSNYFSNTNTSSQNVIYNSP